MFVPTRVGWDEKHALFLENLPVRLRSKFFPAYSAVPMTELQVDSILRTIKTPSDQLDNGNKMALAELYNNLSNAIERMRFSRDGVQTSGHCYVRLGSRHMADSMYGTRQRWMARDGFEAFTNLMSFSKMFVNDLTEALSNNYQPNVIVMPWIDIKPHWEFRGFIRGGQFLGLSQRRHLTVFSELTPLVTASIAQVLPSFVDSLLKELHVDNVVFDCCMSVDALRHPDLQGGAGVWSFLTSLHPFCRDTGSCLYSWDNPKDFIGKVRWNVVNDIGAGSPAVVVPTTAAA